VKNVLSIDVEDWFHILEVDSTPDIDGWIRMESRVEKNFFNMLDAFDNSGVKVTCFFLGWIAEKLPRLAKEADERGHEIACHGYSHQLIYTQTRKEFAEDIGKAKKLLEDITGKRVLGYRAPGFSIIESTRWAFDELCNAGYLYDSSIFPATRGHGGIANAKIHPHKVRSENGEIIEFPITVITLIGKKICLFGGGYLRLFPYFIIRYFSKAVNKEGRPVIFYIHPREIDPEHPRLPMGIYRRFKSYVNLHTTFSKVKRLINDEEVVPFRDLIAENKNWNQGFER
jgi:polysaccharide deacetylase family protein (PEP-CTERM system associated)